MQRIIDTQRRGVQSGKHIAEYYVETLRLLDIGKTEDDIIATFSQSTKYGKYMVTALSSTEASPNFNSGSKSEVYIKQAYSTAPRCAICGGLLHSHSISIDHIMRKRDGGVGSSDNGQLAHPYCNTGVKN